MGALGAKMAADERPPTAARSAPAPAPVGEEAPEPKAETSGPVRSIGTDCGEAGFRASPCHAAPCSTGSGGARSGDTGCGEAEARSGTVTRKHANAEHVQDTGHPLEAGGIRPIPRGASWQRLEDEGEEERGKPSTAALPFGERIMDWRHHCGAAPETHRVALPRSRMRESRTSGSGRGPQGGRGSVRHTHRDPGSAVVPSFRTIPPTRQESIPMTEIAPVAAVHEVGGASAAWAASAPATKRRRLAGRGSVRGMSANEGTGR